MITEVKETRLLIDNPTKYYLLAQFQFFNRKSSQLKSIKKNLRRGKKTLCFSFTSLSKPVSPKSDSARGVAMLEP